LNDSEIVNQVSLYLRERWYSVDWQIIATGYKSQQLKILTVCIFSGFYRTGAHFSGFCISTPVFTMDTRTLLDELLDSHGPSGLFVSFEGPDYDMLLLKCQSAVINGHYEVGVSTHPDTPAVGNSYT
jgi:hypothetical protein